MYLFEQWSYGWDIHLWWLTCDTCSWVHCEACASINGEDFQRFRLFLFVFSLTDICSLFIKWNTDYETTDLSSKFLQLKYSRRTLGDEFTFVDAMVRYFFFLGKWAFFSFYSYNFLIFFFFFDSIVINFKHALGSRNLVGPLVRLGPIVVDRFSLFLQ